MKILPAFVGLVALCLQAGAFSVAPFTTFVVRPNATNKPAGLLPTSTATSSKTATTRLYEGNKLGNIDGSERGNIIMAFVFFVCVWLFSIPPEFRRAHICTTQVCVENRARCYDCRTFEEWTSDIKAYYAGGGGIQFDFSIAPETKQTWNGVFNK